jgi:hypothetical protein
MLSVRIGNIHFLPVRKFASICRDRRGPKILLLQFFRMASYHEAGYQDHQRPGHHDDTDRFLVHYSFGDVKAE